jgi:hypothetical protein
MPYSNTGITTNFIATDFTSNKPSFSGTGTYAKNLKFANKTKSLQLGNKNYGYLEFEVSYSGAVDYISINFEDPNKGYISVSSDLNSLYRISTNELKLEFTPNDTLEIMSISVGMETHYEKWSSNLTCD